MDLRTHTREADPATSSIIQEAAAWDSRLRAPDCTDETRAHFTVWRDADPAHSVAFERLQLITASLRHDRGRADVRALRDEALRAVSTHRRHRRVWVIATAASVLAVVVALWVAPTSQRFREPFSALIARLTGADTYTTGIGQRSTFVLEDGSSVELNARSKMTVSFTPSQRNIELLQGQGIFNVARKPRRPFIVRAGNREIIAVGTEFDVRLDTHSVQVTLIEGKVRVTSPAPVFETIASATGQSSGSSEIFLTPGKQLIAKINEPLPWDTRSHAGAGDSKPRTRTGDSIFASKHASGGSSRARTTESTSTSEQPPRDGARDGAGTDETETTDVIRNIDVAKVTSWRDGRVFLEDLSLEDAIAEMNKYSTTQIEIADPSLAHLRVNGMFIAGGQQAFATALENYFPIVAERHGDKEILLSARR